MNGAARPNPADFSHAGHGLTRRGRGRARWATLAWPAGVPLALAALVWALYGECLGYAFMYDDGLDLPRGVERTVGSLLTSGEGAYYYRPLPFLLWKGLHTAVGGYDPFWFHLPPLALHAVNAWLVYGLACLLRLPRGCALLAAALFALTPFHYQTVPWAGALFHPLVTALLLSALLSYARWRGGASGAWLLLSLASTSLALFTQEYAVMLGFLIAGVELVLWRQGAIKSWRPYAALYLILAGAFALWWLAVPKWPRTTAIEPLAQARNALLFFQAAVWPLALTWRWAPAELLPHAALTVGLAGGVLLAGALLLARRAGRALPMLAALGWIGLTALPAAATLSWEYLLDGPRLYYLPSVGAALGWASLPLLVPRRGKGRLVGLGACVVLGLFVVWSSLAFQVERRAYYAEGTRLLRAAAADTQAAAGDRPLLFVNFPAWRAPPLPAFPLGTTGVTYVPEYVLLGQALQVNGGAAVAVESVSAPERLTGGWPLHYGPHGRRVGTDELAELLAAAGQTIWTHFQPVRLDDRADDPTAPPGE